MSSFPLRPLLACGRISYRTPLWRYGDYKACRSIYPIQRFATDTDHTLPLTEDESDHEGQQVSPHDSSVSNSDNDLQEATRRIYMLGVGSVGRLVAHSLSGLPNPPPITLLLRRASDKTDWQRHGESIEIIRHGISEKRQGFEIEMSGGGESITSRPWQNRGPIHNLIVTVKAPWTVRLLAPIAKRLTPESTIIFLQGGMGVIDEVNAKVFPDPRSRPHYIQGLLTHSVQTKPQEPFTATHSSFGTMALCYVPEIGFERALVSDAIVSTDSLASSSRYLLRTLTRTSVLSALGINAADFLPLQLEKLAASAVISPLTALYECTNGELLYNVSTSRMMRLLIAEISLVIRSLPELRSLPNLAHRFSPERIERAVVSIATLRPDIKSLALTDVETGQPTEIDYINGYFVRRGDELGIRCLVNYSVTQLVRAKSHMMTRRLGGILPLEKFNSNR